MAIVALECVGVDGDGRPVMVEIRPMSDRERSAWALALFVARKRDQDTADDILCRKANDAEEASVGAEQRGMHGDAVDLWRVSELFDVARKALI